MGLEISGIAGLLILIADIWQLSVPFKAPHQQEKKFCGLFSFLFFPLSALCFGYWQGQSQKNKAFKTLQPKVKMRIVW